MVSKLSPGQAAYHFLAGYQDGKFVPAYIKGPSPVDPLALTKAFFSQVDIEITCKFACYSVINNIFLMIMAHSYFPSFFAQLRDNEIPAFLINVNNGGKHITGMLENLLYFSCLYPKLKHNYYILWQTFWNSGKEIIGLAVATLSSNLPESKPGVADSKSTNIDIAFIPPKFCYLFFWLILWKMPQSFLQI